MIHAPLEILKSFFLFFYKTCSRPIFNLYSYPFPGGKDDKTSRWTQIILFQEEQKVVSSYLFSAKIIPQSSLTLPIPKESAKCSPPAAQ